VGPIFYGRGRGEAETLASCYRESIRIADEHGLHSLAFPAISTGAYGYPVEEAAPIAISAAADSLSAAKSVNLCRFVLFDAATTRAFEGAAVEVQKQTSNKFQIKKADS
jgi:O-acetyl-ADP-ribose deacetylase